MYIILEKKLHFYKIAVFLFYVDTSANCNIALLLKLFAPYLRLEKNACKVSLWEKLQAGGT